MTREETIKIMAVLKAAYPSYYKGMRADEANGVVALWWEMFADDEYPLVAAAVKAHIATDKKGFPPHIGAIKDALIKITSPEEMSEMEAWGMISKALSNGLYGSKEEFSKLPEVLQRIVGSPNQLREWAAMPTETVQSVVQSNFMRSYRARAGYEREYLAMPSDVKTLLAGVADTKRLPEPKSRSYDLDELDRFWDRVPSLEAKEC